MTSELTESAANCKVQTCDGMGQMRLVQAAREASAFVAQPSSERVVTSPVFF
jgi:hypothetical protein